MIRPLAALAIPCVAWAWAWAWGDVAAAQTAPIAIVETHVLPAFATLDTAASGLESAALAECNPTAPALRAAYGAAFDAWVSVSHIRLGPTERADRGFALAFWPDNRGRTPKSLTAMIRAEDPVVEDGAEFRTVSVAVRGFYALEFLLYDPAFADLGGPDYRCRLIQAIARDIAQNAAEILAEWRSIEAELFATAGENDTYRSVDEANQALFKALSTGLEFTRDLRLGRPLGTFERPRPNRAEARRSGRSLRHVELALAALRDLALMLADGDDALRETLTRGFDRALDLAGKLDDPVFAGVADPSGRFRIEALQSAVKDVHAVVLGQLGPKLGVAAGFNSLDGD
ncbi:MAG: imelysin family protein [Pseudomonadota bacterium]